MKEYVTVPTLMRRYIYITMCSWFDELAYNVQLLSYNVQLIWQRAADLMNWSKMCSWLELVRNAAGQLNFLSRQSKFLNHDAKRIVIESFVLANFNYCPLVWHFCSCESMRKLERIQERAFRLLLNNHESDYEQLLTKVNKPTLEIRRLKFLATEIFKTINNLNPPYMKEIF